MISFQNLLKSPDSVTGASAVITLLHRINRDQIHMGAHTLEFLAQLLCTLRGVVYPFDQRLFKGYPPPCLLKILPAGSEQLIHGILMVHRHRLRTNLIIGCMQGD